MDRAREHVNRILYESKKFDRARQVILMLVHEIGLRHLNQIVLEVLNISILN